MAAVLRPQHSGDPEVLADTRPINAHQQDFVVAPLGSRRALQARIPLKRHYDLPTVGQRNNKSLAVNYTARGFMPLTSNSNVVLLP
jgi:hypothetical protein